MNQTISLLKDLKLVVATLSTGSGQLPLIGRLLDNIPS